MSLPIFGWAHCPGLKRKMPFRIVMHRGWRGRWHSHDIVIVARGRRGRLQTAAVVNDISLVMVDNPVTERTVLEVRHVTLPGMVANNTTAAHRNVISQVQPIMEIYGLLHQLLLIVTWSIGGSATTPGKCGIRTWRPGRW